MNRFENRTLDKNINAVIIKANELLKNGSPMMLEILHKNDFKYDSGSGAVVFSKISNCEKVAPIFFYKPKNPFTRAMGYSDGKAIYLNSRKFKSFSHADLVGLLIHEACHLLFGFSHGSNSPSEEKNKFSVPYFMSSNISKWI